MVNAQTHTYMRCLYQRNIRTYIHDEEYTHNTHTVSRCGHIGHIIRYLQLSHNKIAVLIWDINVLRTQIANMHPIISCGMKWHSKRQCVNYSFHTFSAFWLRSSVVSVLISLISDTCPYVEHQMIKLIFGAWQRSCGLALTSVAHGLCFALLQSAVGTYLHTTISHNTTSA